MTIEEKLALYNKSHPHRFYTVTRFDKIMREVMGAESDAKRHTASSLNRKSVEKKDSYGVSGGGQSPESSRLAQLNSIIQSDP